MTDIPDKAALLPCPFCGGPAEHDSGHYDGKTAPGSIKDHCGHAIYCADMSCIGCPSFSTIYETEDEAIAAWNRRTALAAALPHMGGEPVAWRYRYQEQGELGPVWSRWVTLGYDPTLILSGEFEVQPLYLAPPANPDVAALIEAAQEVVAGADTMRSYDLPGTFRRHLNEPLYELARVLSRLSQNGGRDE